MFPVQLTTSRIGNTYPVDAQSAECDYQYSNRVNLSRGDFQFTHPVYFLDEAWRSGFSS